MKTGTNPSEILPVYHELRIRMSTLEDEIRTRNREYHALKQVADELLERLRTEGIKP